MHREQEVETSRSVVVLLHGIWQGRWAMWPLASRLRGCGLTVRLFGYHSLWRTPQHNAELLGEFVARLRDEGFGQVNFLAHSLGGVLVAHYLARGEAPPGRDLLLGSPLRGSRVAARLKALGPLGLVLGRAGKALLAAAPEWPSARALRLVVGTRNVGIGRLFGLAGTDPGDGTVAVAEAEVSEAVHISRLTLNHTTMLLDRRVAQIACDWFG